LLHTQGGTKTCLRLGGAGGPGVRSPAHARGRTLQRSDIADINAVIGATALQQPRMGLRPDTRTTDPTWHCLVLEVAVIAGPDPQSIVARQGGCPRIRSGAGSPNPA